MKIRRQQTTAQRRDAERRRDLRIIAARLRTLEELEIVMAGFNEAQKNAMVEELWPYLRGTLKFKLNVRNLYRRVRAEAVA